MKSSGLKVRMIAPLALICFLVGVTSPEARAQSPTSGAMLTIKGTAGGAVNITLYDSQIHSQTTVQAVPVGAGSGCNANDALYPTDAYVLQGGSWTGCDPGDSYEVTDNNSNSTHQASGKADISNFHVETHYLISPGTTVNILLATQSSTTTTYLYSLSSGPDLQKTQDISIANMADARDDGLFVITSVVPGVSFTVTNPNGVSSAIEVEMGGGTVQVCNTSLTICGNPDTGFLTVTNNTGDPFTGTI